MKLVIEQDIHAESPLDEFEAADIVYSDRSSYRLGNMTTSEAEAKYGEDFLARVDIKSKPVYAYVHSGVTVSTRPFSCPWDSGQSGYVLITKDAFESCVGGDWDDDMVVDAYLDSVVRVFDTFLTGDVWCVRVESDDGEVLDSLCEIYGRDSAEADGEAMLKDMLQQKGVKGDGI